jgi:large subunit ribosomal protein L7A
LLYFKKFEFLGAKRGIFVEKIACENRVVGIRECKKAAETGKISVAYIARDAEMHVIFQFENFCKNSKIKIIYADSKKELAQAFGIDVPTAVAAILKSAESGKDETKK